MSTTEARQQLAQVEAAQQAATLAEALRLTSLSPRQAEGRSRDALTIQKKRTTAWLLKRHYGWTNKQIGNALGGLSLRQARRLSRK